MNSHLSRSMQSMRGGIRVCMASTSKQGIATSSSCLSEDTPPTSMTSSMQQTQTQLTFPKIVGGGGAAAQGGGRRALRSPPALPPYPDWVQGQGKQYEEPPPGIGPFWIGATPFPLNPSFDPPPPISQSQKKVIWDLHRNDPNNTIRVLSGKYGISMERIQAILRLQALEAEWTEEGKPLQQPFQKNMERLLGATGLSQGGTYEEKSAVVGKITVPRGPTFEDISFGANARREGSIILPALEEELKERQIRTRTLPTGGPAAKGPSPDVMEIKRLDGRAGLTIVDMSKRPTSYVGGGVVARNERRAEKKREYRAKRRKAAAAKEESKL